MRLKSLLIVFALAGTAGAQVWEKPIAPGLVYRMEIDSTVPRVIHALRFSPGSPVKAMVQLAGKTVYEENATKGRATVSEMASSEGAIAAINGDFFPYTGDPLGAMVRSGQLVSVPTVQRASFGWSNVAGSGAFGIMKFKGTFQASGAEIPLDNIDGECPVNGITLNTETAAFALAKTPNVHVILKVDEGEWSPNGSTTCTVQGMTADVPSLPVPAGSAVLVAQGSKTGQVTSLRAGDRVVIRYQCEGFDWSKVDQLIGGGPFLVRDGAISTDVDAEKFKSDFTAKRHPRSAVGKTLDGDFWFVAVDGRQSMSDGATIRELGEIMARLGCRDAINLDGGGSTDMNVLGVTVNRPSDGVERPVANAILFFGPRPEPAPSSPVVIETADSVDIAGTAILRAKQADGSVPDADVIWTAQGGAWVDQGGLLKPLKPGSVMITACVKGQIVSKQIMITGVLKPARTTPISSRGGDRVPRKKKSGGKG